MPSSRKSHHLPTPVICNRRRSSPDYDVHCHNNPQQQRQRSPRSENDYGKFGFQKAVPYPYIDCGKINVAVGSIIKFNDKIAHDHRDLQCIHEKCREFTPQGQDFFKHPLVVLRIWYEKGEACALVSLKNASQGGKNPMPLFNPANACESPEIYSNDLGNTIYLEHPGGSFDRASWFQHNHAYKVKLSTCIPFNPYMWLNRLEKTSYLALMGKLGLQAAKWISTDTVNKGSEAYVPMAYDPEWDNLCLPTNIEVQDTPPITPTTVTKVSAESSMSPALIILASNPSTTFSWEERQLHDKITSHAQQTLSQVQKEFQNVHIAAEQSRMDTNHPTTLSIEEFPALPTACSLPQIADIARAPKRKRRQERKVDNYRPGDRDHDRGYERHYDESFDRSSNRADRYRP